MENHKGMAVRQSASAQGWRAGRVGFAVSYRNRISDPTLFSGPRARIAAPRRDLPIRRAEAWIAKGLPRVAGFLTRRRSTFPLAGSPLRDEIYRSVDTRLRRAGEHEETTKSTN